MSAVLNEDERPPKSNRPLDAWLVIPAAQSNERQMRMLLG